MSATARHRRGAAGELRLAMAVRWAEKSLPPPSSANRSTPTPPTAQVWVLHLLLLQPECARAARQAAALPGRLASAGQQLRAHAHRSDARRRCQLTKGSWCAGFHQQQPEKHTAPRQGNKTCPGDCSGRGTCNRSAARRLHPAPRPTRLRGFTHACARSGRAAPAHSLSRRRARLQGPGRLRLLRRLWRRGLRRAAAPRVLQHGQGQARG
jgi:hypothetical protein